MEKTLRRRNFLKAAIGGLAGASFAWPGARAAFAATGSGELAGIRLSENLLQITGAGGNVVVLTGPERFALVDSGAPEHAEALMSFIAEELGEAPVDALFNTHWHLPHTGANPLIGGAGGKIFAHENTRLWMSTEYYVDWEDETYSPRPPEALPTDTFHSFEPQPLTVEHGGHQIEYAHLPEAHTDGDIYVRFPGENVIVAGDVLAVGAYPTPDSATGGWIGGLENATRKLIELSDASTRIVPGTGPVQTRADLEAQLEMLTTVHERIEDLMRGGRSAEEMVAAGVTREYDEARGDPAQFVSNVYDGMWWGGRLSGTL